MGWAYLHGVAGFWVEGPEFDQFDTSLGEGGAGLDCRE